MRQLIAIFAMYLIYICINLNGLRHNRNNLEYANQVEEEVEEERLDNEIPPFEEMEVISSPYESLEHIAHLAKRNHRQNNDKRILDFQCKKLGGSCAGIVPCCGSHQCYWQEGYNPIRDGVCVECVQQGQICQRDMQCCPGFVCQKDRVFHINGVCDIKRPVGSNCHDTDQCESNRCNFTGWQWARFQEGKCL